MPIPTRGHLGGGLLVVTVIGVDLLIWNGDNVTITGAALPSWLPVSTTVLVHQSLWWRRSHPGPVLGVQVGFALACLAVPLWQPVAGLLVATYAAGARLGARHTSGVILALAGVALAHGGGVARSASAPGAALLSVAALTALLLGTGYAAGRRQHAARRRAAAARAAYRLDQQQQLQAQRLRIARELHDGVAGTVTTLLLQAAGARAATTATLPEPAAATLAAIEDQAGRTLDELRRLVSELHLDPAEEPADPDTLARIADAILAARRAGLPVEVRQQGQPVPLTAEATSAVLRTVQEGLTNALKHGDRGSSCTLTLRWAAAGLNLTLRNTRTADAPARRGELPQSAGGGCGLASLAARAAAAGGELRHGPVPGGYLVQLHLPALVDSSPASHPAPAIPVSG